MSNLASSKLWQRKRAVLLHDAFRRGETRMQTEGITLAKMLSQALALLENTSVQCGTKVKVLRISFGSLKANYYRWKKGGRTADSLLLNYTPGRQAEARKLPRPLIQEFHRRLTLPGMAHLSVAYKSIVDDWLAGKPIPGVPPAAELLSRATQASAGGRSTLDFPYSRWTFYKHQPTPAERALGNKGFAAFKAKSSFVTLNYSRLRKCELFVLDDVRLDIIVLDDATGQPIELKAYIMMEAASRFIPGYVLKPAAAIRQEDVDELIAYTLQVTGIGRDYPTHIKLERGTVAMSDAAQTVLEAATHGRIKIHRTSMDGGVRWVGSHADKRSGHWMGKAVIESFMRKLHLALMTLPGQRGNKHENQPANLGIESMGGGGTSAKFTPGSLAAEAQKLAQFQIAIDSLEAKTRAGGRCNLHLPMLYLSRFEPLFKAAIDRHNHEPGHDYSGHGHYHEAEIAPGIWKETDL